MSTDTQLKGDSLRRQLEASEKYAKDNGLELLDSLDGISLKDIGVSAFKSKNIQKGVLSLFLDALENGKIKPNSVLLIESLDRLSRDRLSEALPQFISILNKGVEIVTLADNQKYTKEIINHNPGALFISLGVMFRANEESEIKSKRLTAAWANKRNNADKKILTKTCPAWMKLNSSTGKFELIQERAEIVKMIFDMCINTCGLFSIARHLNEKKIPVFGSGKIWYLSYVKKIIENRAVIGEFHPHHYVNGKREKVGDAVSNYYPKVIDEETFLLAQVAVTRRSNIGKGRKGTKFTNLFSGLIYCGLCGFRCLIKTHNSNSSSGKYLTCSNKIVSAGCNLSGWNLSEFEEIIFRHLREINFTDLIDTSSDNKKVSLDDQIDALLENIKNKESEIERAIDFAITSSLSNDIKDKIQQKITTLENEIKNIQLEVNQINQEIEAKTEAEKLFNGDALKDLLQKIELNKDDYLFRSSLNQFLLKLIERIDLIDSQDPYSPWEFEEDSEEVLAFRKTFKIRQNLNLDKVLAHPDFEDFCRNYHRSVRITYKTGVVRYLLWGKNASIIK